MEAKFISQDGRDFVISIDGEEFEGVIPFGMEGAEEEAIKAFARGKIEELERAAIQVEEVSIKEGQVI